MSIKQRKKVERKRDPKFFNEKKRLLMNKSLKKYKNFYNYDFYVLSYALVANP